MTEEEFKEKLIIELRSGKYKQRFRDNIVHIYDDSCTIFYMINAIDLRYNEIISTNFYNTLSRFYLNNIPFSICALLIRDFDEKRDR